MKNYYHTLELRNCASMSEIRRAFRSLALTHHPDRGGSEDRMKEINEAYDYLLQNKEQYDQQLTPTRPSISTSGFTIIVGGGHWQQGAEVSFTFSL